MPQLRYNKFLSISPDIFLVPVTTAIMEHNKIPVESSNAAVNPADNANNSCRRGKA